MPISYAAELEGWFGGMGERWKIDGRRRKARGPGMPGPYGVAEG